MPKFATTSEMSNGRARALIEFQMKGLHRDLKTPGLLLRVGARKTSWLFLAENRVHGERVVTSRVIGDADATTWQDARKEAQKISGRLASDRHEPGKRKAAKFGTVSEPGTALESYISYLKRKAAKNGKDATWAKVVESLSNKHMGKWAKWSLADMVRAPHAVAEWHKEISESAGPSSANHCARIVRAAYKREARTNTSLPRDRHPCTAVEMNEENPREVAITDWKAWRAAWDQVENPTRKAYHLFALLTGCRPGEAARVRCDGFNAKSRTLTIKNSKSGLAVTIPLSRPIIHTLRMARDARMEDQDGPFVFPARRGPKGHMVRFDSDGLPWFANALRHTYLSVAASIGIPELIQDMLTTHTPRGVSQEYFVQMIVNSGPAMRTAQGAISRRIVTLLGGIKHVEST